MTPRYSHDTRRVKGINNNRHVFGLVETYDRTKGAGSAKCRACNTESHWSSFHCEICGEILLPNPSWNIHALSETPRSWGPSLAHSSTSRCKSCHSECDWNSVQCDICGEPFERISCMSPVSVCTNMTPTRTTSSMRKSNQSCRDCKASYSTNEDVCPICGCDSEVSPCAVTPGEPNQPFEWALSPPSGCERLQVAAPRIAVTTQPAQPFVLVKERECLRAASARPIARAHRRPPDRARLPTTRTAAQAACALFKLARRPAKAMPRRRAPRDPSPPPPPRPPAGTRTVRVPWLLPRTDDGNRPSRAAASSPPAPPLLPPPTPQPPDVAAAAAAAAATTVTRVARRLAV